MEPTDITVEILKDIRDEVRQTNTRIDETNRRIDETNRRIVESEVRTSTAIVELTGTVRELSGVLRATHDLRPRVERCEHDIAELRRQVGTR